MIIVKAWNRPLYFYKAMESLAKNDLSQHDILVGIDGGTSEVNFAQHIDAAHWTVNKKVQIVAQQKQLGCAGHTIALFEWAFEKNNAPYIIHMEDDHILSQDCIEYLDWASTVVDEYDYFAACSFHRPVHQDWENKKSDFLEIKPKRWFDGSGPIMITKYRWNEIKKMGGMFGVDYISEKGRTFDCYGEPWLKEIRKSNALSWVWPLHKYFADGRYSLFPKISRSHNIGAVGLHANRPLHEQIQYNEDVADNYPKYDSWFSLPTGYHTSHSHLMDSRKFIEGGIEQ